MSFSTKFKKKIAWFSIIGGIFHFAGESYFIIRFGQPFLQTLADIIAVSLLLLGGFIALKNNKFFGILCGAWGFTFCLNYRAWLWRYYAKLGGTINSDTDIVSSILLVLLFLSFLAFSISILLNIPKNEK